MGSVMKKIIAAALAITAVFCFLTLPLKAENENAPKNSIPENVTFTYADSTVTVSWDGVTNAKMYYIYSQNDPYGEFAMIDSTASTTWSGTYFQTKQFFYVTADVISVPEGFVYIPGGTFGMGDSFSEGHGNERPVHQVTLSSFYMGKYEVTQSEWQSVMTGNTNNISATPSHPSYGIGDNYPVNNVGWRYTLVFCNRKSMAEGLIPAYTINSSTDPADWGAVPTSSGSTWDAAICNWSANGYRLTTDAEWEYAARGGVHHTDNYRYSGCHNESDLENYAWYSANDSSPYGTKPVGTRLPNQLGLYDMTGNVWEWCWDWFQSTYYQTCYDQGTVNNPTGPAPTGMHFPRGGDWYSPAQISRVAFRGGQPLIPYQSLGFRVARTTCGPAMSVNPSSLVFGSKVGETSPEQTFNLMGIMLTADITVTAPTNFQVSASSGSGFANSINFTPASGSVDSTVYVRFIPTAEQEYSGNISLTSTGAIIEYVSLNGTGFIADPVIGANPTTLSFGSVEVGQTSSNQTFTLTGSNLTSNITVTAPTGFQVSASSGSGFANSINFTPASGSVDSTVYVRFIPTAEQEYSGNISLTSTGVETINVSVSGTGIIPTVPLIVANLTTLSFGNVEVGQTSPNQTFTLTGSNLTANITVTAPTGYQVSASSDSGFANSISFTPSSGSVNTTVYVCFSPLAEQSYTGNISCVSTGATTVNVSVSGTSFPNPPEGFVYIPSGIFQMGDSFSEGMSDERPVHSVTLNSFYMGKYEVTQGKWSQYMPAEDWSSFGTGDSYPAYGVSWYKIIKYCNLRSMAEGLTPVYTINSSTDPVDWGTVPTSSNSTWNAAICNWSASGYRLPTEAEWEYAARGGLSGQRFPNGATISHSTNGDTQATYNASASYSYNVSPTTGYHPDYNGTSSPVGSFPPNEYGLYDMAGNILEWCWDRDGSYTSNAQTNPTGPTTGTYRVTRGGNWVVYAYGCRVADRHYYDAYSSSAAAGFRLVRTP
jgi:formylglycine-generating enzyme required for sulfatase activity